MTNTPALGPLSLDLLEGSGLLQTSGSFIVGRCMEKTRHFGLDIKISCLLKHEQA